MGCGLIVVDRYAPKRRRVARILRRWATGDVILMRSTTLAPDPATPWIPGEATTVEYTLDARTDGTIAAQMPGTTVQMTDLVLIASPVARRVSDGVEVEIVPVEADRLTVDGVRHTVKRVEAVPAAGPPALFKIYLAS